VSKILVVEDDVLMREFVALILGSAGYTVETAQDGIEAGMAVLTKPPALIVADVLMPGLDGFQFVATLRQLKKTRDIPVIFLTSHAAGETRGKELGAIAVSRDARYAASRSGTKRWSARNYPCANRLIRRPDNVLGRATGSGHPHRRKLRPVRPPERCSAITLRHGSSTSGNF
jgi:CheY-like chemotaxis protein